MQANSAVDVQSLTKSFRVRHPPAAGFSGQVREVTLLLTSHHTGDIERVCDRVVVIHRGALL